MPDRSSAASPLPEPLLRLADYVRTHGLATPALLLLGIARPLGFVLGHGLAVLEPLVPGTQWRTRLGHMASALEDEATWTDLEKLLQ